MTACTRGDTHTLSHTRARTPTHTLTLSLHCMVQGSQAMKIGVPVVATPIALEGLLGQDGANCLIATSPQEFGQKVAQLHSDCGLWQQLVDGAAISLREHFSAGQARAAFLEASTDAK